MVPAGADLMMNMASVLQDPQVFENPEQFDPDRYLTGDITLKKQRTIPFSMGESDFSTAPSPPSPPSFSVSLFTSLFSSSSPASPFHSLCPLLFPSSLPLRFYYLL